MFNGMTVNKPQANYIFIIRGFYMIILLLALVSIYLNYGYIRRTMKVIFQSLGKAPIVKNEIQQSLVNAEDMA